MSQLFPILVTSLMLALAGCTSTKKTTTPDGRPGYSVECSGRPLSWEDCFTRAGELCSGRSYDVYPHEDDEDPFIAARRQRQGDSSSTVRRMVIACKGS